VGVYFSEGDYEDEDNRMLGMYLETAARPEGLTELEFRGLRRKAKGFFVHDRILYKCSRQPEASLRRAVGQQDEKERLLEACHDESGYRGINSPGCMRMFGGMSELATNVSGELECGLRNFASNDIDNCFLESWSGRR
jgi:hypothetical protein